MPENKFMLIDGNSLLFRAFYALPLLRNSEGVFTNGVYGFITMLKRVMAEQQPSHILVAFDKDRKTFRSDIYSDYKANRQAPPDEIRGQFQLLREVLEAMKIDYLEQEGYEADDIIGTLSKMAEEEGIECVIVTGDGDALQLVSDKVTVLMTKKGISEMEIFDTQKVMEKWEVEPARMIEIKALMGDSSDNIPGVPGVGPKTAIKLIKEFLCLEGLYDKLSEIKGKKLLERLTENKAQAFLSRQLATIVRDMDIKESIYDFSLKEADLDALLQIYRRLEFKNFIESMQSESPAKNAGNEGNTCAEPAVQVLDTKESTAEFVSGIGSTDSVSVYIEADYHHPMWAKIQGIYLDVNGRVYHLPIGEETARLEWMRTLFESDYIPKYLHNSKYAQVILKRYGIELQGVSGDTMLLAYVNDPAFDGEDLSDTIYKYLNITAGKKHPAVLVNRIRELYSCLREKLSAEQQSLFLEVEMPLSDVLAQMEFCGLKLERNTLMSISAELAGGLKVNESRIYELAGEHFNINSPKQLGKVLFENLGLRVVKKTKTGYSTGAEVLEELSNEHEIIPHILNYRQLTKLKSTYADALQGMIHPETGRVHSIFKQAQTATGRLSSVEPNLQNIPIRMEEGRKIRRAFIVESRDWMMLSADYSQIDLRSLAHISNDQVLIDTFKKGIDVHTRTAAEIFKVPLEGVDEDLRRRAKAVNFGIIYGISDFGLSRDTGVSRQEARKYIDNYLDSYPGVRRYMQDIVEFGRQNGYVETILKRRRYLPDLNAKNKMLQSFARRMALNTPVQGSSADIIKLAMIRVHEEIKSRSLRARLLLQVHDDLLLEVPENEFEEVMEIVKYSMENAYELRVPLLVSLKSGPNWYEMQEIKA